jgi:hypothetical protein
MPPNQLLLLLLCACLGAGSFVTVEKDSHGVWWFKHGEKTFMSRGINHVNNGGQDDGVGGRDSGDCKRLTGSDLCGDALSFAKDLDFSPYFNSTMDRYGSEDAWANNTVQRMQSWNFNTIGGWSGTHAERAGVNHGMYYAHLLDIGTTWFNHLGLDFDLWSDEFAQQCERIASKEVAMRANDEFLLGYQLDNELHCTNLGLVQFLQGRLNYTKAPGQQRATRFLATTYNNSIQKLNAAWGINASDFDDVKYHLADKGLKNQTVAMDNKAWLGVVIEQYMRVSVGAVKKYDQNHLIIGMRGQNTGFRPDINLYPEVLEALIPYIDVFDFHSYEDLPQMDMLAHVHNTTGKPILLGEFSFIAWDSNLPNNKGARSCTWKNKDHHTDECPNVETTQGGRARGFTRYVSTLVQAPFVVGYHWWQWADEPGAAHNGGAGGRWPDGEDSNYGVVHLDDDPYGVLTEEMTSTNGKVEAMHAGSTPQA